MAEDKDTRDEKANEEQDERQQEKGAEEQEEKDDKEKSDPVETDDKPADKSDDNKPQDPDIPHADIEARIDGLAQSMNSLIDLCTSILGAVQKEPAAEESHDPSDPDKKDDRLDDFASLLDQEVNNEYR